MANDSFSIHDQVSDLIAQKHLHVGTSIATKGAIILGNMRADKPQLHQVMIDDRGRLWKETYGPDGAVTLIFAKNMGWL